MFKYTVKCKTSHQVDIVDFRHRIFVAFSAYHNGKKLIKIDHQSGQFLFFNGLKVISMFWVVLGHRFESNETMTINKSDIKHV